MMKFEVPEKNHSFKKSFPSSPLKHIAQLSQHTISLLHVQRKNVITLSIGSSITDDLVKEAASITSIDLNKPSSLPIRTNLEASDLLLCFFILESIPMSQFYMICSEARRILNAGGVWAIITPAQAKDSLSKIKTALWNALYQRHPLEMTHYISPEDWKIEHNEYFKISHLYYQVMILQKIEPNYNFSEAH